MLYDGTRKLAFAARDPSGHERLWYHVADDGSTSFASAPLSIAGGEQAGEWAELPPGHYITTAGRAPKLCQFALTPHQLHARELRESLEECGSAASSDDDFAVSPRGRDARGGAASLPVTLKPRKSLDLDVFSLDI